MERFRGEVLADLMGNLLDAVANAGARDEDANTFARVMNGAVNGTVNGGLAERAVFEDFAGNFFNSFHQVGLLAEWKL